jgi:hypothetical protein
VFSEVRWFFPSRQPGELLPDSSTPSTTVAVARRRRRGRRRPSTSD